MLRSRLRLCSLQRAFQSIANSWNREGPRSLWRGNSATIMRVFPYAGIQFMTFERIKFYLKDPLTNNLSPVARFVSGSCAGVTATIITYPLDLLRVRSISVSLPLIH